MLALSASLRRELAWTLLFIAPACFCANMITAREMVGVFPHAAMPLKRWRLFALFSGGSSISINKAACEGYSG